MTMLRASVVIPAHDEEAGIAATLHALLASAEDGEFEVVVVCNGCRDGTAAAARAVPGVRVEEIPQASKIAALRHGDATARTFPRIYLDADVVLPTEGARELAACLGPGGAAVAGVGHRMDTTTSTPPVRWYFDFRQRLPVFRQGIIGAGVYALSREGRARFGAWPDVLGDDQFVLRLFSPAERAHVTDHRTTVIAPADLRTLVRRQLRVRRGNRQLTSADVGLADAAAPRAGLRAALRAVAGRPAAWPGAVTWLVVNAWVRVLERLPSSGDWAATRGAR